MKLCGNRLNISMNYLYAVLYNDASIHIIIITIIIILFLLSSKVIA